MQSFSPFATYSEIACAFSTKLHGSMKKDDGSIHHASVLKFVKQVDPQALAVCMHQVHGKSVRRVENNRELVIADTDALITNKKHLALVVLVADCLPIMFYDPEHHAIGVCHAGSKGLLAGVIQETIKRMHDAFGTNPKQLVVGIGPSIEQKCYEVSEEYATLFIQTYPTFHDIVSQSHDSYYLDLRLVARYILEDVGVSRDTIEINTSCTKCEDGVLYSYRNGDISGRIAGVVSLV